MSKRDIFAEIMTGIGEMAAEREGKITLRQHKVEAKAQPKVSAKQIVAIRMRHKMSQEVFARVIRTKPATLRNWEQGKAKPNPQAAMLLKLVERHGDMLERMEEVG
ncbi:helix-turn-helix domain-containing protein [uncultured Pseudomonas sp.]|uniref:helix-turn-helix domain-containing protein n=1 Tax=uncultured Pseudomonas sp. TaxID=114707 RepID=UPI0025DA2A42|nr:helix-turn-helix domain-containing protein [uncultured Pseudomonas sp.]